MPNSYSFSLLPLAPAGSRPELTIPGQLTRQAAQLAVRFALQGRLETVALPASADLPVRRHGLWQETCFEFFLAPQWSPGYWEFNLSPAGHWNVYCFTAYRQGMTVETAFTALPFSVRRRESSLLLDLEFDLTKIIPANQALEVAVATVIKLQDGTATYWALTHPGPQADFHRREGFVLTI